MFIKHNQITVSNAAIECEVTRTLHTHACTHTPHPQTNATNYSETFALLLICNLYCNWYIQHICVHQNTFKLVWELLLLHVKLYEQGVCVCNLQGRIWQCSTLREKSIAWTYHMPNTIKNHYGYWFCSIVSISLWLQGTVR